jgi:2,3,4,5-tetrahydropyridine-2,6-dicarboxylate N-succinyltransferase
MLRTQIEALYDSPPAEYDTAHFRLFAEFKEALNRGEVRAAERDANSKSGWRANEWVKKGILAGFRIGVITAFPGQPQTFLDKSTYPPRGFSISDGIRIVPGGSSIRDGSCIGRGVVCMPPMFVNVGAYVGENTMIDSHALIGSCAQIGQQCHISAAAQIGGVLEPVGALPVIIEDDVMVGGNCGLYEGTVVKRRAVLGTGTILNRSIRVYDLVHGEIYAATDGEPLIIPENAVVVPGTRAVAQGVGAGWGLSLQTAVIIKYRDARTDARVQLEDLLR